MAEEMVRRTRLESQLLECMGRVKKWGTNIFFWGAINSKGISGLVFIEGKMDSKLYIEVLKEGLLPMYNRLNLNKNEVTFQENSDPKHQSVQTKKWKEKAGLKYIQNWTANSPYLNPIENVWAILKREVSILKPTGVEDKKQHLLEKWRMLEANGVVLDIIRSMPKRIRGVIKSKGHSINY